MKKPPCGNTDVPAKSTASKTKRKTTNVQNRIIIKKLTLLNKTSKMTDNNNKETVNLSDLDILDQTTIEIELSGNEPSVQSDSNEADDPGEVLEIPEEENSEEEHDTELDPNIEPNEEQLRYVFNTVEGEQYIVQGTSDGRVEMITLDQGGNQTDQEDSGSENGSEVVEVLETTTA